VTLNYLRVAMLGLLGLVAFPHVAAACACERLSPQQRLALSDGAFVGRVVGFEPLMHVDLEVRETFKGQLERQVRIPTGVSDCDYFLPPVTATTGRDFLIYASIVNGTMTVNRCLGSGPLDQKRTEVQRLRQRPK